MPTKADIKKILSKGLTGKEAGRLVFKDNWMVDSNRGGFLSEKDISYIKAGMKKDGDIKDYNSYIRLYQLVDYTLKDARIMELEAVNYLQYVYRLLEFFRERELARLNLYLTPAIVTQKQYEELSAKQREMALQQVSWLEELISHFSGVELDYLLEEDEPEPVIDFQKDERLRGAVSKVQELLRAGKLHPLKLKGSEDYYEMIMPDIPSYPAEEVIKLLDKLLAGELSWEEDFMRLVVFRNEELYNLEETSSWMSWRIDVFKPDLDSFTSARPEGMMQSSKVAIIQNPTPDDIDEKGYWIDKDYSGSTKDLDSERLGGLMKDMLGVVSERIKGFLAVQVVLDAISKVMEVDFLEDLESWYKELQEIAGLLNKLMGAFDGQWERLGLPELKPIKPGRLRATPASLRYYRERMAMALGDKWWEEAINTLEYEQEEPDTLAQEFSEELEKELVKRGRKNGR